MSLSYYLVYNVEESTLKDSGTGEEISLAATKFTEKVLERFGDMVKCIVLIGSVVRGEYGPSSDIDMLVIMDDVNYTISKDDLERYETELRRIADEINKRISPMPILTLTEFWDYARIGHPYIYNFLKEGIALYDTGFFLPVKKLLEMGKIPITQEAINKYMEEASQRLFRAETIKLLLLADDCYYAIINTAQAVLMSMGVPPPVPRNIYREVVEKLVKPGLLKREYAEWLREIIQIRKRIEHKELKQVDCKYVDEWLIKTRKFVNEMFSLKKRIDLLKTIKTLERVREVVYEAMYNALKDLGISIPDNKEVPRLFKEELIDKGMIDSSYWKLWLRVEELMGKIKEGEISAIQEDEVHMLREGSRKLVRDLGVLSKN